MPRDSITGTPLAVELCGKGSVNYLNAVSIALNYPIKENHKIQKL